MRKKRNKKFGVTLAYTSIIAAIFIMMLIIFGSCNTPKATERRDIKRVSKAQARNPFVVASACASFYPPTDSTYEHVVYKEGKTITKKVPQYITTNCDSLVNLSKSDKSINTKLVKIPCPPCDSIRIDTLEAYKYQRDVERSKTAALQIKLDTEHNQHLKDNADNQATISKLKTELNYLIWAACIAWGLILLRLIYAVWLKKYFAVGKLIK